MKRHILFNVMLSVVQDCDINVGSALVSVPSCSLKALNSVVLQASVWPRSWSRSALDEPESSLDPH